MMDMETTITQMQTVMESMTDPVILTDPQHRVITQNKAAERYFRLPDDVSEGRVRAVELNNLLFSAALSSMAVSGNDSSRDMTLVDAIEGDEVLFEAVSAPSFAPDGRRTGMVTVLRDVTDLRRADEELRANYEKLRQAEEVVRQDRDRLNLVIENVGDPIVVCDRDAKVALLDPLAQELLGTEQSAHRTAHAQPGQARRLHHQVHVLILRPRERADSADASRDPQEVEYDARSGKIYDERGLVAYTVTVLRDLTAVRRLEQLKMERRMLEMEKFAAAGRLAGTIAHEVNNPMEAIKNCIFLLTDQIKPRGGAGLRDSEGRNRARRAHRAPDARPVSQHRAGRELRREQRRRRHACCCSRANWIAREFAWRRELDAAAAGAGIGRPDSPGAVEPGGEREGQHEPGRHLAGAHPGRRARTSCSEVIRIMVADSGCGIRREHAATRCSSRSSRPRASAAPVWVCGLLKASSRITAGSCECAAGSAMALCSPSNCRRCNSDESRMKP